MARTKLSKRFVWNEKDIQIVEPKKENKQENSGNIKSAIIDSEGTNK